MLKLFHNDMSVCAQKVRMVLDHKGLEWVSEHLNLRAGDQFRPEFLKLNPKGVVPVLLHDDAVITESNVIIEYLEELFPEPPLMPVDPVQRARIRAWLIKLDAGLHENVAVISFCVAFRHQLLQRYKSPQELDEFFKGLTNPARAALMQDVVPNGLQSDRLLLALYAYNKLLQEMSAALSKSDWLVSNRLSLVDFGFVPYIERLQQLKLDEWWKDKPEIDAWLERVKGIPAYQTGMADRHSKPYIELMAAKGTEAWPTIDTLIRSL